MINLHEFKQSVLQKAMQGKLTKQLHSDGNASNLLKSIQRKKHELVKAKKIKKHKPLKSISKSEIPFEIPKNWKWTRLGEIGDWKSGSTPNRHHPEYYKNGVIPWLKTGDLNDGYINNTSEKISEIGLKNNSLRLNPKGSVLMAMYGATISRLGILNINATTNQACCACVLYKGVYNKFLFYYLLSQRRNFVDLGFGGAQPNISRTKIIHYPISIPPLSEQKRIVRKVHKCFEFADTVQKERQLNQKFAKDMKQSLLRAAMQGKLTQQRLSDGNASDLLKSIRQRKQQLIKAKKIRKRKPLPPVKPSEIPFAIPRTWRWTRLGNIALLNVKIDGKLSDSRMFIRVSDMHLNGNELYLNYSRKVKHTSKRLLVPGILFPKTGGAIKTNARRILLKKNAVIDPNIMCLTPIDKRIFKYVWVFFKGIDLSNFQQGTSVPKVNQKDVYNILIPLPPLLEQMRIILKLTKLLSFIFKE